MEPYTTITYINLWSVVSHIGTMRPRLPDSLKKRAEQTDESGDPLYRRAGYTSVAALAAAGMREKLEELEDKYEP